MSEGKFMTKEEHAARHKELHKALDELVADFIENSRPRGSLTKNTIFDLIMWSSAQCDPATATFKENKQ
jgi:hypothetical protein